MMRWQRQCNSLSSPSALRYEFPQDLLKIYKNGSNACNVAALS